MKQSRNVKYGIKSKIGFSNMTHIVIGSTVFGIEEVWQCIVKRHKILDSTAGCWGHNPYNILLLIIVFLKSVYANSCPFKCISPGKLAFIILICCHSNYAFCEICLAP